MEKTFKIWKETAVPATWIADSVYFIQPSGNTFLEVYTTSVTGVPKKVIGEADIQGMITAGLATTNEITIVADIAARNALAPKRLVLPENLLLR